VSDPAATPTFPPVSPIVAGLRCRCPRCGRGRVFGSRFASLAVAPKCEVCGLDLAFVDPGDGPAVFAIMLLGFMMLGAALFVEFRYNPPVWIHIAVFGPLTIVAAIGIIRPLKALLIASQYHHKSGQGRFADPPPPDQS
jgi:uncharacterized protein (DUF983 family)